MSHQSFDPNAPPAPPPKPNSREISRRNTPASGLPPPLPPPPSENNGPFQYHPSSEGPPRPQSYIATQQQPQDPGDQWLPKLLEDKSYVSYINNSHLFT